ncbi:Cytochrome P450 2U1 [Holothuria leucospilota]|uniref:Cytochrome P450 2U1 n=1 Tax=Holothuria leucospilota TaxID=206669 RepID=A0A9Q1BBN9_HOLLE|nr:Cytochrome P450 2U1 [Holothuria leucospilota]
MTCMRDLFMAAGSIIVQIGHIFPILRPLLWKQINDVKTSTTNLSKFLLEEIAKIEEKMDAITEPENFIQSYLLEMKNDKKGKLPKVSLQYSILDLFAAGTETTSSTLLWGMLYMMMNPEVQKNVQKELDEVVIGRENRPSWTNKSDLPYTEATILEIQRLCSLVPVIPHATVKPTTLGGYNLPAKCEVWMNLW